jgi:hypothetical protein
MNGNSFNSMAYRRSYKFSERATNESGASFAPVAATSARRIGFRYQMADVVNRDVPASLSSH